MAGDELAHHAGRAAVMGNLSQMLAPDDGPAARSLRRQNDPLFGFPIRQQLFPGEDAYFKSNPTVGGMAAETGDIILNPYSSPDVNRDAVARNEALRLLMRQQNVTPDYKLSQEQLQAFKGTPYATDQDALRASIAGRIYSGDPSAQATPQQRDWLAQFMAGTP